MADNWPFFLVGRDWHSEGAEGLPRPTVSHSSSDLDADARDAVEGICRTAGQTDPATVLCARWLVSMEAI